MAFDLFYCAKPVYGGWVSFTAHLALKHDLPIYKIGNRTEEKNRPFGYGIEYRNIAPADIKQFKNPLITAIDKNFYDHLKDFPDNTLVVIHDPSEVTKKTSPLLIEHLKRFRIVVIRESVKKYLKERFGFESLFLIHPFYAYDFTKDPHPSKAVCISRIDFDKHIDIILEANKHLPAAQQITLHGAANNQYVFFKLEGLNFKKFYKGTFEKTFEALNAILKDAKWVVDMSVIKDDGGGSQYTFLEAIHQKCALVINSRWVDGYATPFKNGENCYVVKDGDELADLIKSDPNVSKILKNASELLEPHLKVDWVAALKRYSGKHGVKHTGTRKAGRGADRGKTRKAE